MGITIFLAQLWGPAALAMGLGVFISRNFYLRVYRDIEKETLAVVLFAFLGIVVGVAQVNVHNEWGTFAEALVSFLGWALLIKGVLFAIVPKLVDRAGNWAISSKLLPIAGGLMVLIGIYLSWVGFLS